MKTDPANPSNRRISIIVRNEGLDQQEEKFAEAPAAGAPASTQTANSAESKAEKHAPAEHEKSASK